MKCCTKCKIVLDEIIFNKDKHTKDGFTCRCKKCIKEHLNEVSIKQYRVLNIDKIKESQRKYRSNHKEIVKNNNDRYRNLNKDKLIAYQKEYREKNKEITAEKMKIYGQVNKKELRIKANERRRKRMVNDIEFKLLHNLRRRFGLVMEGKRKSETTKRLIGCDLNYFKSYLENKFTNDMSWDNYGSFWEIDHIIPCKYFNLLNAEEQKRCFHYTNLQPLSCVENRSKGAKIIQYEY